MKKILFLREIVFVIVNYKIINFITGSSTPAVQSTAPALLAGMPIGPGVSPQPGFYSRGIWLPVVVTFPSGQAKST